ncbi:MAG: IS200/IS605 family transposase [Pseudoflavonifractor sp.]|nr:IS200/IS605 family transposase [Pseudoflavonifractor sp.]
MSYVSSLYHVVFATRCRRPVIDNTYRDDLYRVMASIINDNGCKPLVINGVNDHVHIMLGLNPGVALSRLMRDLKSKSSVWVSKSGFFPLFDGWEREYGAFSLSYSHKNAVYDYIMNQQRHHDTVTLDNELNRLVLKAGLTYYTPPAPE